MGSLVFGLDVVRCLVRDGGDQVALELLELLEVFLVDGRLALELFDNGPEGLGSLPPVLSKPLNHQLE